MAYCPDCGVRSENGAPACSSCGLVFSAESTAIESNDESVNQYKTDTRQDSLGRPRVEIPSMDQSSSNIGRDSQLGKGTIKPYSMELGVDGYHFKFEEPPRRMSKPDSSKDKSVEFRVTHEDINRLAQEKPDLFDKTEDDNLVPVQIEAMEGDVKLMPENLNLEESAETTPITDSENVIESLESSFEPESISSAPPIESAAEETMAPSERQTMDAVETNDKTPDVILNEEIPVEVEIDDSSAELHDGQSDEIPNQVIWKGNQTFLGIPLSERYQMTNRSIIVEIPKSGRHYEYSLSAVITATVKQTWLDKLSGTGHLKVKVMAGTDTVELVLKGLADPINVLRILADRIGPRYNKNDG